MSNEIFLPFLQRSRRKSPRYQATFHETFVRLGQRKIIYVHTRKGSVLETSILNGIECPICWAKNLLVFELLRAHVACFHPKIDFQLNFRSRSQDEVTFEARVNYDSAGPAARASSTFLPKRDALTSGEERYLIKGKLFVKRKPASATSTPQKSWTSGHSVNKRVKHAAVTVDENHAFSQSLSSASEIIVNSQSDVFRLLESSELDSSLRDSLRPRSHQSRDISTDARQSSIEIIPTRLASTIKSQYFLRNRTSNRELSPSSSTADPSLVTPSVVLSRASSLENRDPRPSRPTKIVPVPRNERLLEEVTESNTALDNASYGLRSCSKRRSLPEPIKCSELGVKKGRHIDANHNRPVDLDLVPVGSSKRRKLRFRVPFPPKGVTFYSSATKRPLKPGEYLTDSDDDVNEDWTAMKRDQIIDSSRDTSKEGKLFMKRWNAHFETENLCGDQFFADAFLRFVASNDDFLQPRGMRAEFKKVRDKLKQEGLIEDIHVLHAEAILKEAASKNDASRAIPPLSIAWSSRCICGEDIVDISNAVFCLNEACSNPEYHVTCVMNAEKSISWRCPSCATQQTRHE